MARCPCSASDHLPDASRKYSDGIRNAALGDAGVRGCCVRTPLFTISTYSACRTEGSRNCGRPPLGPAWGKEQRSRFGIGLCVSPCHANVVSPSHWRPAGAAASWGRRFAPLVKGCIQPVAAACGASALYALSHRTSKGSGASLATTWHRGPRRFCGLCRLPLRGIPPCPLPLHPPIWA